MLVFISLVAIINCQCEYEANDLFVEQSVDKYKNFKRDLYLDQQVVENQKNVGFGIWIKYMPFYILWREVAQQLPTKNFFSEDSGKTIFIKEKFMFSMKMKQLSTQSLILSNYFDEKTEMLHYKIIYQFQDNPQQFIFEVDKNKCENYWYSFYLYFDTINSITQIGLLNQIEGIWQIKIINEIPTFLQILEIDIGGESRVQQFEQSQYIYENYIGRLTNLFTTQDFNFIMNNQNDCFSKFLEIRHCQNDLYSFEQMYKFIGDFYSYRIIPDIPIDKFIINGWIKLDELQKISLETIVLRITINSNFNDDEFIGDKFFYLKYYQNQISELNGFELQTYSYILPIPSNYQTTSSDIIANYDSIFEKLFTQWHLIQFERGSSKNNGQPVFSIYSYQYGLQEFTWDKQINYFSNPTLNFFFGGDKYSKNYLKGYMTSFSYQSFCNEMPPLILNCFLTCESCSGPNYNSCITCSDVNREFEPDTQTCPCINGYYDLLDSTDKICYDSTKLEIQYIGNYDINTNCDRGYFSIQGNCIQCPYFMLSKDKTQILCADCYNDPKNFAISLTCTYDYKTYYDNPEYTYSKYLKQEDKIEFFKFDSLTKTLIKLNNSQYNSLTEKCDQNQILINFKCVQKQHCQKYSDQNIEQFICIQCEDGYYLNHNECLKCGQYCQKCNSQGLCLYCENEQSYYLTFNGIDCSDCNIENCVYCFQYYEYENYIYSTLDQDFMIQNTNILLIKNGCALCKNNYFFNFQTSKCELKCEIINNNIQNYQQCQNFYQDCHFGLIDLNNNKLCLTSQNSQQSIQNRNCNQYQNCLECINSLNSFVVNKCVVCKEGYYLDLILNKCFECSNGCLNCYQQNIFQQDYWKQQVYTFYQYIFNENGQHPFEQYAIKIIPNQMEINCIKCLKGFVLYQNNCIKDCDDSCVKCEIIDGKSICIQCPKTNIGYLKSKNNEETCIQCPYGCSACEERSIDEIYDYNPYFILQESNIRFTRKCFELQYQTDEQILYLDTKNQMVVKCKQDGSCYDKVIIPLFIYCSPVDYQVQLENQSALVKVFNKVLLDQFLLYGYEDYENSIHSLFNKVSSQQMEFQYNIIQGQAISCLIEKNSHIYTIMQRLIFSLNQIDLHIVGNDNPILEFHGSIHIYNFTNIKFSNITFYFPQQSDPISIIIDTYGTFKNLIFSNITFQSEESEDGEQNYIQFNFSVQKPYNIQMNNVSFINFKIINSSLFSMTLEEESIISIQVNNIQFYQSSFINSTMFLIKDLAKNSKYQVNIQSNNISKSFFQNFSYFWLDSYIKQKDQDFSLKQTYIYESQFINCLIFQLPIIINFKIEDFKMFSSQLQRNTYFFSCLKIELYNVILQDNDIFSSSLLSNDFQIINSDQGSQQDMLIIFNNIQILNQVTDNSQSLIKLRNQILYNNFQVNLNEISVINSKSSSNFLSTYQNYKTSLLYLECQICIITQLEIERNYGVIELSLLNSIQISIKDFFIKQSSNNSRYLIHPNFDCIRQNLFPYTSTLVIAFYRNIFIDNLQINECITLNQPIIKIQGYDSKYQYTNESIIIKSSSFQKNILIISDQIAIASVLYIESSQISQIQLNQLFFQGNVLHNYRQQGIYQSSSTLLINSEQGNVTITQSQFIKNLAINSKSSILYLNSYFIQFESTTFLNNNNFKDSILTNTFFTKQINQEQLFKIFPIQSESGNGKIISRQLKIKSITVDYSKSNIGGSFFIQTNGEGMIQIQNTQLLNANGGLIYIDASQAHLNLTLFDSIFSNSYNKQNEGALYIIPSKRTNVIFLSNLSIINVFSSQHSFLSYKLPQVKNTFTQIVFENILFNQSQLGFERLLQQFEDNISQFQIQPMIYINHGNLTLKNVSFANSHLQYLILIDSCSHIIFEDIFIINSTYFNTPILSILNNQNSIQYISFYNVLILKVFQYTENIKDVCNANKIQQEIIICSETDYIDETNITQDIIEIEYNKLICNKIIFFQQQFQDLQSLIDIQLQQSVEKFFVEKFKLDHVQCQYCLHGALDVNFIQENLQEIINLKDIQIQNNKCGIYGCISIFSQNLLNNPTVSLLNNIQNNQEQNYSILIQEGKFINNSAQYGGALYLNEISIKIIDSIFTNNKAEKGGAIFYDSTQMQIKLLNTSIINNYASIGGGLYMKKILIQLMKSQSVTISENNSTIYGNEISENPSSLTISFDGGQTFFFQKVVIQNSSQFLIEKIFANPYNLFQQMFSYIMLPSGIPINEYKYFNNFTLKQIPMNLTFRIIALNSINSQEKQLKNSYCTLQTKVININSQIEVTNIFGHLSEYYFTFNDTSGDFNLDNLIIYFNPYQSKENFLRFIIECNMIQIPTFENNLTNTLSNLQRQYQLYVDIQTFPCQIGEYFNYNQGACIVCDVNQNLYSLTNNASNCTYKDDTLINQFTSQTIQLRNNYWRAFNSSTKIELCYNLQANCLGGWLPGDDSCALGHIGALCESCDLYNIRNQGQYSISSQFSCGDCNKIVGNILILIAVSIWVMISILLSVNSTLQTIEQIIFKIKLKVLINQTLQRTQPAILVKLFTNYLQIILSIQSFQLQVPTILSGIYIGFGNPLVQMSYSFDCFIINMTNIEINYFRIIWNIIIMMFFLTLFFIFELVQTLLSKIKLQTTILYTAILYIYTYFHPNIISILISQVSYREISDIKWIQGNVSYQYDTNNHIKWLFSFILPLLQLFGVLIPIFLLERLYRNRNKLDQSIVLMKYGYLINEYKSNAYFWDIIKIFQRQMIIVILNYYQDFIAIKASLIVIILFSYSLLQAKLMPYKTITLNSLEKLIMQMCSISIISASCIYQAQIKNMKEIIWIFEFSISYLNLMLSFYLIVLILQTYFQQFFIDWYYNQNLLLNYCPKCILTNKFIQQQLQNRFRQKQKVKYYYSLIRQSILPQVKKYLQYKSSLEIFSQQYNFNTESEKRNSVRSLEKEEVQIIKTFFNRKIKSVIILD